MQGTLQDALEGRLQDAKAAQPGATPLCKPPKQHVMIMSVRVLKTGFQALLPCDEICSHCTSCLAFKGGIILSCLSCMLEQKNGNGHVLHGPKHVLHDLKKDDSSS